MAATLPTRPRGVNGSLYIQNNVVHRGLSWYQWPMNPLFAAAKEMSEFMAARDWKHCIIGGLAVQCWGQPRLTRDVDLALLTGVGNEESFVRPFPQQFAGRLPDTLEFAIDNRVLLIRASNGKDIDISLGALEFEIDMLERAAVFEFAPDCVLPVCSAEDLFVMKAFAARPQDWLDAESIAVRQQARLDATYILGHLTLLAELKEAPEILERARHILGATP